jgi:hypothetical protein
MTNNTDKVIEILLAALESIYKDTLQDLVTVKPIPEELLITSSN